MLIINTLHNQMWGCEFYCTLTAIIYLFLTLYKSYLRVFYASLQIFGQIYKKFSSFPDLFVKLMPLLRTRYIAMEGVYRREDSLLVC